MKKIELKITAESPLAIGRQKPGGSVNEAENYIPGSVIRGAIASQILKQSSQENSDLSQNGGDFQALFLSETPVIFQNAYPASAESETEVKVLPATALSSKNKSGFKSKNNGVFDSLIDRFCAENYGETYDFNCPSDGERVEPYGGFYSQKNGEYESHSVTKRLLTRVGINRQRSTAEEAILYSIEVLNEVQGKEKHPAIYRSSIIVENDTLADALLEFINFHNFRLGGSISRGLGKVKIKVKADKPKLNIDERLTDFNQAITQRFKGWQDIFGKPIKQLESNRIYFTINLQSDAILTEQWRRTTVISEEMLREFAQVDDQSLKLEVAYSSYDYHSGWNSAWGLMKNVELITNKGGVYLFSTTQRNLWIPTLEKLEMRGVGERTCEGFGQIQICNEFHLVFRENAV